MTIRYNHEKVRDARGWEDVLGLFLKPPRARLGAKVIELLLKPENRLNGLTISEIKANFTPQEARTVEKLIYKHGRAVRWAGESYKEHDLLRLGIITNRGTLMLRTGRWTYSDQFAGSLALLSKNIRKIAKEASDSAPFPSAVVVFA